MIAPTGVLTDEMAEFVGKVSMRSAESIAISDDAAVLDLATIPIGLPATLPEWLSPFTCITVGQLLAMHLSATRGYDVDAPRAISKVTETV